MLRLPSLGTLLFATLVQAPGWAAEPARVPRDCPLFTPGGLSVSQRALCAAPEQLGDALLVRAEERLLTRALAVGPKTPATTLAAVEAEREQSRQRIEGCAGAAACLQIELKQRRAQLEKRLADATGPWPVSGVWNSQGSACSKATGDLPFEDGSAVYTRTAGISLSGFMVRFQDCGARTSQGYWHGLVAGHIALVHDFVEPSSAQAKLPSTWLMARVGSRLLVENVMGASDFAAADGTAFKAATLPQRAGAVLATSPVPSRATLEAAEAEIAKRLEGARFVVPYLRWPG